MPTEESLDIPLETIDEWEPKTPTSEQATETSEKTGATETAEKPTRSSCLQQKKRIQMKVKR